MENSPHREPSSSQGLTPMSMTPQQNHPYMKSDPDRCKKENGQVMQMLPTNQQQHGNPNMPNICGELPGSDDHSNRQRMMQQQQRNFGYEMPMPDAILTASMVKFEDSPECGSIKSAQSGCLRRSSLTCREQQAMNSYGLYESGSRTVPRPPKRTTPTVKFGPETTLDGMPPGSGGNMGQTCHVPNVNAQTLKPSLKKSFNSSNSSMNIPTSGNFSAMTSDELNV